MSVLDKEAGIFAVSKHTTRFQAVLGDFIS